MELRLHTGCCHLHGSLIIKGLPVATLHSQVRGSPTHETIIRRRFTRPLSTICPTTIRITTPNIHSRRRGRCTPVHLTSILSLTTLTIKWR